MSKLCDFLEAELENRQSAGGDETDYVNEAREALAELASLRALLIRAGEALADAVAHLEEMRKDERWHPIGHCPTLDKLRVALTDIRRATQTEGLKLLELNDNG